MSKGERRKLVAMVTIGQSPRTDVTSDIADILGEEIGVVECGALDNLDDEAISSLAPTTDDDVLVTRLRNGSEVQVSHERVADLVNKCISLVEAEAQVVVFLCTGDFKGIQSRRLLIMPSELLFRVVQSILPQGRAGILIPSSAQVEAITKKWNRKGLETFIQALSPYQEIDQSAVTKAAERFSQAKVDLVVLDCIGYSRQLSQDLKELTGLPVILARTIVARVVNEIL